MTTVSSDLWSAVSTNFTEPDLRIGLAEAVLLQRSQLTELTLKKVNKTN